VPEDRRICPSNDKFEFFIVKFFQKTSLPSSSRHHFPYSVIFFVPEIKFIGKSLRHHHYRHRDGWKHNGLQARCHSKKILILERGGFIPKEKQNWDPHEVVTLGRYRPKKIGSTKTADRFKPYIHYNVGGNSKMYGACFVCVSVKAILKK
jgi:hypothetical protein